LFREEGKGLPPDSKKDLAQALKWYAKAADQKLRKAVNAVARLEHEATANAAWYKAVARESEEGEPSYKTEVNVHL